jgi:hypothetical protein
MVKHGAISRAQVYRMLASKQARLRHAAFTLLEASNPRLRKDGELFMEIVRFIWDANPSYEVYREFSKRHLFSAYKVHELIAARIKIENQRRASSAGDTASHHRAQQIPRVSFFQRLCNTLYRTLCYSPVSCGKSSRPQSLAPSFKSR